MTENNKWIKVAILIVAVIVIIESLIIISRQNPSVVSLVSKNNQQAQLLPTRPASVIDLKVNGNNTEMKLKNSYKVWVEMTPRRDVSIDAIDLYVKYDKSAFKVSKLDFSGMTIRPTVDKISDKKSVVVVNYYVTDPKGLAVKNGKMSKLVGFEVTPLRLGKFSFEIGMGDEDGLSKTLIVENTTSKELPFDVAKLEVSVK